VISSDSQQSFKIGNVIRLTGQLVRHNWRKLLWLYVIFLLVPGVILGELGDTYGEFLYDISNSTVSFFDTSLDIFVIYAYQIPTALFFGFSISTLLNPRRKPQHVGLRAFLTILLLQLVPIALTILSQKILFWMPELAFIYAVQVAFLLFNLIISVFTYVAPAVATTKWNPATAIGKSLTLVWPHWFRVLLFVLLTNIFVEVSRKSEEWLLLSFQTQDGTALDWLTTILQELIRSGHLVLSVALLAAVFSALKRSQEGAPAAETATIFD
jgi:hypothetical protein